MIMQQPMICGKYHRKTGYLLGNVDVGIWEFAGMGYHVDDVQMTQTVESQIDVTWESHKSIAQINHTKQSRKTRSCHIQE